MREVNDSGERVSNAWVIYLEVGDTPAKVGLIPNVVSLRMEMNPKAGRKACCFKMSPRPIS
jgi:hypothetical protein